MSPARPTVLLAVLLCLAAAAPLGAAPLAAMAELPGVDVLSPLGELMMTLPPEPVPTGRWVDYMFPARHNRIPTDDELLLASWDPGETGERPSPSTTDLFTARDGDPFPFRAPSLRMAWNEERSGLGYAAFELDANAERSSLAQRRLFRTTNYVAGMHIFLLFILRALPESVTKWDDEDRNISFGELADKWKENAQNGPVMDSDELYLNWIVHPLMGSTYYMLARRDGMDRWGSFWYSVFISTCVWEYGIECFAEEPSTQDLFITPIVGSLVGEFFLKLTDRIRKRGYRVWGSPLLGSILVFMIDPLETVTNDMENDFNRLFHVSPRTDFVHEVTYLPTFLDRDPDADVRNSVRDSFIGLRLKFPF